MKELKTTIKELAAQQKELRNQRKTKYIKGKRQMSAGEASLKHSSNRIRLSYLYATYGVLRGKPVKMYIPKKKEFSITHLQTFIDEYREEAVRIDS